MGRVVLAARRGTIPRPAQLRAGDLVLDPASRRVRRGEADIDGLCRGWADRAAGWALESGDTTMATYMTLRGANLALDQGDHRQATELAVTAQNVSWPIPPALRGVALAYEARGRARTGTVAPRPAR